MDDKFPKIEWHLRNKIRGHASWSVMDSHLIVWASIQEAGDRYLLSVWWPERLGLPPGKHLVYPAGWISNYVSVESSHRSEELAKKRAQEVVLGVHNRVIEARRAELLKELKELEELQKIPTSA